MAFLARLGTARALGRAPCIDHPADRRHGLGERFDQNLLRHTVHGHEERALLVALVAHAGHADVVGLAVHRDVEVGRREAQLRLHLALRARLPGPERAGGALLEKLTTDLREHGIGEHVLFALRELADLLPQPVHLGFEAIGRAAGDDLLVADRHLAHGLVDLARRGPVAAL